MAPTVGEPRVGDDPTSTAYEAAALLLSYGGGRYSAENGPFEDQARRLTSLSKRVRRRLSGSPSRWCNALGGQDSNLRRPGPKPGWPANRPPPTTLC